MRKRLRKILSEFLPEDELLYVYNSYDIVGDIAILRLTDKLMRYGQIIAEALMGVHRNVKTVLAQTGPVCGDFRIRKLEYIAGENKTVTLHRESGCLFRVDVEKCYFSPRLSYERMRIAKQVRDGEVVINMFAGVGCFSIVMAKHSNIGKVYSIDVNPAAFQYMQENVRLNRVYGKVIPVFGDAKNVIEERVCHVADRVLMPLPEKALKYLPYALLTLKKTGFIHYYDFEHARKGENPIEKVKLKVAEKLENLSVTFDFPFGRIVRSTGPNWYQVALDIAVKH
ncbi:MAG: class I SAM-dependent methyltransferase family protein [Candidatus Bathyarchaeota archaeon]|nr:class I SAM-dependent methyltransferase family protein [Candidatus Bathyarchaeota archaeon]MDI6805778.1 class I SAM-dependent methyltransferase family protein [Candidatus Bathyarchaeia archaeon]